LSDAFTHDPPDTPPDPSLLPFAVDIVRRAGELQMAAFGGVLQISKKGAIDLVTDIDVEIERVFRARVSERYPDHDVLGEEMGTHRAGTAASRHCWIFDPIDGTTNFAHGLPIFCASLALEVDGELAVAAVYDPNRRELFTAERGAGAWLNGAPLRVSAAETLIDSLLCTGFPYTVQEKPEELVGLFAHFLGRSRAVRRLGSAAIDLCYVAAGRLDGFWEMHLGPWDVAAGALIVQEAGGRVTTTDGRPFRSRHGNVLATNGRLHDQMLAAISGYRDRSRNRTK
jgi:myo-inositol-1(or 4)-monophosphatase